MNLHFKRLIDLDHRAALLRGAIQSLRTRIRRERAHQHFIEVNRQRRELALTPVTNGKLEH